VHSRARVNYSGERLAIIGMFDQSGGGSKHLLFDHYAITIELDIVRSSSSTAPEAPSIEWNPRRT
jgi:hypothetical protein